MVCSLARLLSSRPLGGRAGHRGNLVSLLKTISQNAIDWLVKLAFVGIAAALTPFIVRGRVVPFAYIWLASILLLAALIWRDYRSYATRPFARKFRNEEETYPEIQSLISKARSRVCVLSKVGTSIFFAFREYSALLERGLNLQVLVIDPNDGGLIACQVLARPRLRVAWRCVRGVDASAALLFFLTNKDRGDQKRSLLSFVKLLKKRRKIILNGAGKLRTLKNIPYDATIMKRKRLI